ncbi:MAG: aminoacyl-tRNA hydrolase [Deltaproteobacteria bacterium]|nr:aminoacyl-tRNA hydrolase [Deltaproteobacteria bacterium]
MRAIIGLGNPGPEYAKTRHNLGFRAVDRLAERWLTKLSRRAFLSLIGETQWRGEKMLLVQPQTYMNRSGEAVARIRDFYHLDLDALIVIHDDLDLPFGRLRMKRGGGGAGGNRGIVSLIETLGSKDFLRVKIGIGRPPGRHDPAHFVVQPFTPQEEAFIVPTLDRVLGAVEVLLSDGIEKAMAAVHASEPLPTDEKS